MEETEAGTPAPLTCLNNHFWVGCHLLPPLMQRRVLPPGLIDTGPWACTRRARSTAPARRPGSVCAGTSRRKTGLADASTDLVVAAVATSVDAARLVAGLPRPRRVAIAYALDAIPVTVQLAGQSRISHTRPPNPNPAHRHDPSSWQSPWEPQKE